MDVLIAKLVVVEHIAHCRHVEFENRLATFFGSRISEGSLGHHAGISGDQPGRAHDPRRRDRATGRRLRPGRGHRSVFLASFSSSISMPRPTPSGGAMRPSTGQKPAALDDVVGQVRVHGVRGERAVGHRDAGMDHRRPADAEFGAAVDADVEARSPRKPVELDRRAHAAPVPEVAENDVDGARGEARAEFLEAASRTCWSTSASRPLAALSPSPRCPSTDPRSIRARWRRARGRCGSPSSSSTIPADRGAGACPCRSVSRSANRLSRSVSGEK